MIGDEVFGSNVGVMKGELEIIWATPFRYLFWDTGDFDGA